MSGSLVQLSTHFFTFRQVHDSANTIKSFELIDECTLHEEVGSAGPQMGWAKLKPKIVHIVLVAAKL